MTLTSDQSRTLSNIIRMFKDIPSRINSGYDEDKERVVRRLLTVFFRDELNYPLEDLESTHVRGLTRIYGPRNYSFFIMSENCITQAISQFETTWWSKSGDDENVPQFNLSLRIEWNDDGLCCLLSWTQIRY